MNLYDLPFARIFILREDIAEVLINDGVEMDARMVVQLHEFLLSHLQAPFSLLINTVNSYSYTFDAQLKLATLEEINVMAVVAYNRATILSTEILSLVLRNPKWHLKIFPDRGDALAWLLSEQDSHIFNAEIKF